MIEIKNTTGAKAGFYIDGQLHFIDHGASQSFKMSESDAALICERVGLDCLGIETALPVNEPEPESIDYSLLDDEALREICRQNGIALHHKSGRNRILKAIEDAGI